MSKFMHCYIEQILTWNKSNINALTYSILVHELYHLFSCANEEKWVKNCTLCSHLCSEYTVTFQREKLSHVRSQSVTGTACVQVMKICPIAKHSGTMRCIHGCITLTSHWRRERVTAISHVSADVFYFHRHKIQFISFLAQHTYCTQTFSPWYI